jgi:capsular polysaccharide biosynthesis protein/Mrp family chromosome partitioning ATPase
MEQQAYLQIFRERWVALVIGVVLGLGVALGISASIHPTYEATSTSFLSVQSRTGTLLERSQFALARISSYPNLALSSDVLSKTISDLGLNVSVHQLANSVTAVNPPTTVLLQITSRAADPKTAVAISDSIAANLSATIYQLENSSSDDRYTVSLELRDKAQPPLSPSAPQPIIILGLGVLGGLAFGLIAAILWARLDTTVRTAKAARRISGLPVIGELRKSSFPFALFRSRNIERTAMALREIQLTIRQANGNELPHLLALVPASRAAAAIETRIGLAHSVAMTGRSVALIEADFDGGIGSIAPKALAAEGLAEVLSGTQAMSRVIIRSGGETFDLLAPGLRENAPKENVAERNVLGALRQLVAGFDLTVTQLTSITRPASLELVAPYADGVVVLVRQGRTRAADLAHVLARLRLLEIRPLGIVMTGVPAYKRTDLVSEWLPGDFNEVPRTSARKWEDLLLPASEIASAGRERDVATMPVASAAEKPALAAGDEDSAPVSSAPPRVRHPARKPRAAATVRLMGSAASKPRNVKPAATESPEPTPETTPEP